MIFAINLLCTYNVHTFTCLDDVVPTFDVLHKASHVVVRKLSFIHHRQAMSLFTHLYAYLFIFYNNLAITWAFIIVIAEFNRLSVSENRSITQHYRFRGTKYGFALLFEMIHSRKCSRTT